MTKMFPFIVKDMKNVLIYRSRHFVRAAFMLSVMDW